MMNKQEIIWFILLLCQLTWCEKSADENKEDLSEAEAKDGLEIVKSIKKINNDGSYTIGYESDDGSFKIESRDVLGNVKGTYGYVDEQGEIKRVSYSSNNLTELMTEIPSVVQRIPKTNKTSVSTKQPSVLLYNPTTPLPINPTSKRRFTSQITTSAPTTTVRSVKNNLDARTTTQAPSIVYATSAPLRSVLYQRPLVRPTVASQLTVQKSEGQLIRPELSTTPATELPIIRRLALKNPLPDPEAATHKHVTVAPDVRSNLLRRQLSPENSFDPHRHLISLQQGLGEDAVDVYSASLTTGTPRPLFTTTFHPRVLPSLRIVDKSAINHGFGQSNKLSTTEYLHESSTTELAVTEPNREKVTPQYPSQNIQPPLIAVRHPYHEGVVLVPADQVRAQEQQPQYVLPNGQLLRTFNPNLSPQPSYAQNPVPYYIPRQRMENSVPMQFPQNGYQRPTQIFTPSPTPFRVPFPTPQLNFENNNIDDEVDSIKPPVSTREFQKLIELLILRQKRLESANALIYAQKQREILTQQRIQSARPLFVQKHEPIPHGAYTHHHVEANQDYLPIDQRQHTRRAENIYQFPAATSSIRPTRKVPRVYHSAPVKEEEEEARDEYLPPQIREMLLLRMLQLAINPSLPLDTNLADGETAEFSEHEIKQTGIRNVEVLGEEEEDMKSMVRNNRIRGNTKSYY